MNCDTGIFRDAIRYFRAKDIRYDAILSNPRIRFKENYANSISNRKQIPVMSFKVGRVFVWVSQKYKPTGFQNIFAMVLLV